MTVTSTELDRAVARIDELLAAAVAAGGTAGVAVAVTDADGIVHVATAGHANVWANEPVRPDHLFEIGSIGKTFTALVLMQLWDEGRLEPDDPVVRHLPWFVARSARPITLADLLTHRSGITAGLGEGTPEPTAQAWALRDHPEGTSPGTRFHYSNLGYKVLGLVIEAVDGRAYPEALRARVLEPLGMTSSEPAIRNADRHRYAVGHGRAADDRIGHPGIPLVPATWLETDTADGSIAAPAADLAALARLVLRRGDGPHGRLVSERAWERMATPVPAFEGAGYGFALATRTIGGRTFVGHNGGMVGYVSTLQVEPATGFGVAVLMNGPGSPVELGRAILGVLAGTGGEHESAPASPSDAVAQLAGTYLAEDGREAFRLQTGPAGLRIAGEGLEAAVAVDTWDDDLHLVPHPDWDRFLLWIERPAEAAPVIWYGPARYHRAGTSAPAPAALDPALAAHAGQYRAHDPWLPTFRVFARGERLWLQFPEAPDGGEAEQVLVPVGDGWFRLGEDPGNPERVRFDLEIDGHSRRAWLGCWPWFRVAG